MNVIIAYLDDMFFFICIVLPIVIIWRIARWKKRGFNVKESLHEIGFLMLICVLIGLFSQTIIPKAGTGQVYGTGVNLQLFRVVKETYNAIVYLGFWQPFYINFLGNIILFMPIGFLLPLLYRRMMYFPNTVIIGLCISLFIEFTQIPQNRSSDVDDLWLNTLGAFLGYLFYIFIYRCFPAFAKTFKKNSLKSSRIG
ncbi:VanZ family protein [Psychrobacillus sp. OK032]|uniref:VanZ family protein n=1 Tax=Psychrobacillus sp. OK032 TaxID=1884358 RepID=UPI0008B94F6C|nr:VanZ family protein [Psychrobacillus sp. OK032]SES42675.1 VanZ like family protein [Psychrobacillus sp. OK032]